MWDIYICFEIAIPPNQVPGYAPAIGTAAGDRHFVKDGVGLGWQLMISDGSETSYHISLCYSEKSHIA